MSVVGFDVGNENCVIGVARQRGIDVVLNEESKRETPGLVSFTEKQRFIGTAAAASLTMNPKNTIAQIKRLIGRRFYDPEVQKDLNLLPYTVTESTDGSPLIHVQYLGEMRAFTPTQMLGMILANLKIIAEKNLGTYVSDCVIGVPVFFTEVQRRAYLDAAAVAGLRPLRLIQEPTATALAYGIYRTDLPEGDPINVVFVDVGHSSLQVCVAAFKKRQLKVLAHAYDRSLGGRDFDEVLFNYFADKFKEEYKIDVPSNARASQRLRAACEKLKKVLSANPQAPLSIECLMDEKDVKGFMTREDFERLASPLLERVKVPCEKALAEANLSFDKIHSVELVGSGSRIPAILRILASVFKKEPSRTLNASECIARGCTLQCAMLSPTFKVREFEVEDTCLFSIGLSWKGPAPEAESGEAVSETLHTNIIFPKGCTFPVTKMLTFYRSTTFTLDIFYAEALDLPEGTPPKISTFTIGPIPSTKSEKPKLKVKIRLNLNGIVSIESATLIEEEEVEVPITKPKDATAMETDNAGVNPDVEGAPDGNIDNTDKHGTTETAGSTEGRASAFEAKPAKTDEAPKEVVKKKTLKRTYVPVKETVVGALPQTELQKAVEREYEMALQDRVMEETKDRKNAVEAYVYDMRNKLYERFHDYATEAEREGLSRKLQETEDWLYEDGEDETKGVYIAKLEELKKLGDPIELRHREEETRGTTISELQQCIDSFREAAKHPNFDHIDGSEKDKVILECNKVEEWLQEQKRHQDMLPKFANPSLLSADIRKKTELLDRFCKPIMTAPAPVPAPAPKPAAATPEPKEKDNKFEGENSPVDGTSAGGDSHSEPMETENAVQDGEVMQTD